MRLPFIEREYVGSSICVYPDEAAAAAGVGAGGSGLLIGLQSSGLVPTVHLYAVTNDHVIQRTPVVSLVTEHGERQIFDRSSKDWHSHIAGDDVAVCYLGRVDDSDYRYVSPRQFLQRSNLARDARPDQVGPGDSCLLTGRYIDSSGRQFDQPLVRFGNLAMLPESVTQIDRFGFEQESFLVDMRSQPGLSGSGVFVYFEDTGVIPHDRDRQALDGRDLATIERVWAGAHRSVITKMWLIGINWGRLPLRLNFRTAAGETVEAEANHGLAAVVPVWKVAELLESEDVTSERSGHGD